METVRFGIIGIGNIGSAHANCLTHGQIQGAVLTALCDWDADKEKILREKYPHIAFYDQAEALLQSGSCDAVIISTPHPSHVALAMQAFENGLHVLVEKPAGVCVSDVYRLNDIAEQSGRVFGIMFNQRTEPLYQKAKALLRAGAIGEMKRVHWIITNWYRTQQYYDSGGWRATWRGEGGGVLLNQAPHNLDLLQWICGMPTRLRAFCYEGKHHHIEVEDEATLYMEYENGATGLFVTSTGEFPGTNHLEITGDCGKIVVEEGHIKLWTIEESERHYCFHAKSGDPLPAVTTEIIEPEGPPGTHAAIIQNVTNAIRFGQPLLAPGSDGIYELSLSNAAYLSSWQDRWVSLPMKGDEFDTAFAQRAAAASYNKQKSSPLDSEMGQYKKKWQVNW
ncbi:MAG: Gfo/Idh/MocA family oxidoreductase [Clostridiales bacterium]|nr:Gfo/Idh/MocA family oxidoreductase [Clostridiales bacterium]